jgi:hypothetical protein
MNCGRLPRGRFLRGIRSFFAEVTLDCGRDGGDDRLEVGRGEWFDPDEVAGECKPDKLRAGQRGAALGIGLMEPGREAPKDFAAWWCGPMCARRPKSSACLTRHSRRSTRSISVTTQVQMSD